MYVCIYTCIYIHTHKVASFEEQLTASRNTWQEELTLHELAIERERELRSLANFNKNLSSDIHELQSTYKATLKHHQLLEDELALCKRQLFSAQGQVRGLREQLELQEKMENAARCAYCLIHTHAHTHMHTHTYTHTLSLSLSLSHTHTHTHTRARAQCAESHFRQQEWRTSRTSFLRYLTALPRLQAYSLF